MVGAFGGDLDEARQDSWDWKDRCLLLDFGCLGVVQRHDDIERFIGELRKGVRLIQPERGEHGAHLCLKILPDPGKFGGVEFVSSLDVNTFVGESGHKIVEPDAVLVVDE